MKTRIIAAVLSFSATFGCSTALMQFATETPAPQSYVLRSNNYQTQQKVLLLLDQDISNNKTRRKSLRRFEGDYKPPFTQFSLAEYSRAVNRYVNESESLDDSDLPRDFQYAWRAHMRVWREHAEMLNQMQDASKVRTMDSREIAQRFYAQNEAISSTWYRVLRIAANYGAFPNDPY